MLSFDDLDEQAFDAAWALKVKQREMIAASFETARSMLHAVASSDVADNIIKLFGE